MWKVIRFYFPFYDATKKNQLDRFESVSFDSIFVKLTDDSFFNRFEAIT